MRHVLSVGGTIGLMLLFTAISGIASARAFGPEQRGILAVLLLWPTVMSYILDFGLSIAIIRRSAKPVRGDENIPSMCLLFTMLTVAFSPVGLILAFTGYLHIAFSLRLMFFGLFIFYTPMQVGNTIFGAISQGKRNFGHYNLTKLATPMTWSISMIAMFAFHIESLFFALCLLYLCGVVGLGIAIFPFVSDLRLPSQKDWALMKTCVREGLPSFTGNLAPIDTLKLDLAGVSMMLSATSVGYYAVAVPTAYLLRLFGHVLGVIALSNTASSKSTQDATQLARRITLVTFVVSASAALVFLPLIPFVVRVLYGNEFRAAAGACQILCVGMVVAGTRQAFSDCLRGMGFGSIGSWAEVGSWVVAIVAYLVLTPRYGIEGAAIATSLTYLSGLILTTILATTVGPFKLNEFLRPTRGDFSALVDRVTTFRTTAGGKASR